MNLKWCVGDVVLRETTEFNNKKYSVKQIIYSLFTVHRTFIKSIFIFTYTHFFINIVMSTRSDIRIPAPC